MEAEKGPVARLDVFGSCFVVIEGGRLVGSAADCFNLNFTGNYC